MTGRRLVLTAVLALALLLGAALPALADGPEMVPPRPPSAPPLPSTPPLYERYPSWNYTWDAKSVNNAPAQSLIWVNAVQIGKAWLLKLSVRSVEYALHLDLGGQLLNSAASAMRELRSTLWEDAGSPLVTSALVLVGGYALLLVLSRRHAWRAWSVLGGATLTLLLAFAIFTVGPDWLQTCADLSRGLGRGVITTIARPVLIGDKTPADTLLQTAAAQAWSTYVYEPWVLGEFGDAATARRYADSSGTPGGGLLKLMPPERMNVYMSIDPLERPSQLPWWWSEEYVLRRIGIAGASGIMAALFSGVLLALGAGVLGYQVVLTLLLATAPLWLLVSLWLPAGLRLSRWALERALAALAYLVLLPALLGVFLALTLALGTANDALGWVTVGCLQALLATVIWRYRRLPLTALARIGTWAEAPAQHETVSSTSVTRTASRSVTAVATAVPASIAAVAPGARAAADAVVQAPVLVQQAAGPDVVPAPGRAAAAPEPALPREAPRQTSLRTEVQTLERRLQRLRAGNPETAIARGPDSRERAARAGSGIPSLPTLPLDRQRRAMHADYGG